MFSHIWARTLYNVSKKLFSSSKQLTVQTAYLKRVFKVVFFCDCVRTLPDVPKEFG